VGGGKQGRKRGLGWGADYSEPRHLVFYGQWGSTPAPGVAGRAFAASPGTLGVFHPVHSDILSKRSRLTSWFKRAARFPFFSLTPRALKKHLWNVLMGSRLRLGPKARLYTSLGPAPQVPCPKNNQGLKARSNSQSPI